MSESLVFERRSREAEQERDMLKARVAQLESTDPDWMATLVAERIDELDAEGEAFDTDCIRAATRLATAIDLNGPGSDPWSAHDLYDGAVEYIREARESECCAWVRTTEARRERDEAQAEAERLRALLAEARRE